MKIRDEKIQYLEDALAIANSFEHPEEHLDFVLDIWRDVFPRRTDWLSFQPENAKDCIDKLQDEVRFLKNYQKLSKNT